jgi:hypothetical protein
MIGKKYLLEEVTRKQNRSRSVTNDLHTYYMKPDITHRSTNSWTGFRRACINTDPARSIIQNNRRKLFISHDNVPFNSLVHYLTEILNEPRFNNEFALHVRCYFEDKPELIVLTSKVKRLEKKEMNIDLLHQKHDIFTDKKFLGTITNEELTELENINTEIDNYYSKDNKFIKSYKEKIKEYEYILKDLQEIKKLLKEHNGTKDQEQS